MQERAQLRAIDAQPPLSYDKSMTTYNNFDETVGWKKESNGTSRGPTHNDEPGTDGIARMQHQLTAHFATRCQQRGVTQYGVQIALRYGRRMYWFHDSMLHYLGDRELTRALVFEPDLRYSMDQLNGIAVIVERGSRKLLTAFKDPRGIHQIAQNYGGRARNRH
jgi:hypothetical protein